MHKPAVHVNQLVKRVFINRLRISYKTDVVIDNKKVLLQIQ